MGTAANKGQEKLLAALQDSHPQTVLDAVAALRKSGDASSVMALLKAMARTEDPAVEQAIAQLLSELKDPQAVDMLVTLLPDPRFKGIRVQMLSACWQCGLSRPSHLPQLLDVALEADYLEVLEVLTILENWDTMPDPELTASEAARFNEALADMDITASEDLLLSISEVMAEWGRTEKR